MAGWHSGRMYTMNRLFLAVLLQLRAHIQPALVSAFFVLHAPISSSACNCSVFLHCLGKCYLLGVHVAYVNIDIAAALAERVSH